MNELIPAWVAGRLTPVDKLEVHRRGLRHKAVSVFVLAGPDVLLQRRALGKYHTPGLWANACCTHPRWGESPQECAERRLAEELGLSGLRLEHRDRVEYRAEVGGGMVEHERVDIYTAEAEGDIALRTDPAEVMAVRWSGIPAMEDEIARHPGRFTPWLRIYMARHRDSIFGPTVARRQRPA